MARPPSSILLLLLLPIGDTLFATPTIRALRRSYPEARIVALAYRTNAGILAANPDIDRLILHPTRQDWPGLSSELGLLWRLNRARFDLLIQFGPVQWWMTQLIRPRSSRRLRFSLWQWLLPGGDRPWLRRHAASSYATLLAAAEHRYLPPTPVLQSGDADRTAVDALLAPLGCAPLVALHPGGEGFRGMKRWSPHRFVSLAVALAARYGARVVWLGGGDEIDLAADLEARVPGSLSLAGRLDLGQTLAVLERSLVFAGNDSAPMHMAAAIGLPTVGIFGPTNPVNFGPRGPHAAVVRSDLACSPCFHFAGGHPLWAGSTCRVPSCLHAISVDAVLQAVDEVVARRM